MGRPGGMVRRRSCDRSPILGRDTQVSNRRRSMRSIHRLLALVLLAAAPAVAHAAVDCTPHFSTVTDTLTCSVSRPAQNDFCLGAKCTMVFQKGATFSAVMTLIADN